MSGRQRKVVGADGQLVDATEMSFREDGEHWNQYLLENGALVRLKVVLAGVYRVDGATNADGTQAYVFQHTVLHHVSETQ